MGSALLLAGASALGTPALAAQPEHRRRSEPLFRLSLAQWSLHRELRAGTLDHLDFAKATREFELEGCEYVNSFFKDKATDFHFLAEMRKRADGEGVKSLLIMIDGEGELGEADDSVRRQAVENHFRWIAAAAYLGCHSIRVNAGGNGTREEVSKRAADSLHRLAAMGETYGIDVIVENHGGYSSDGAWLAGTIERADHPRCGTLPDFGNFDLGDGTQYDRYKGVAELMPYARAVSAKSHDFDAQGNEEHTDYPRMLKIVLDAGYRSYLGIEYEGERVNERDGIRLTRDLLLRIRTQMSGGK